VLVIPQELAGDELELRLSAEAHHHELIRREQREDRIRALMRELAHRSKNLLAVVQAIARQTASNSRHVADYVTQLSSRILGLSHTHDLIADENWKGARLDDLAARQLAPFLDVDDPRIRCDGPLVMLSRGAEHWACSARTRYQCSEIRSVVQAGGANSSHLASDGELLSDPLA
jgi:hypothetical protein